MIAQKGAIPAQEMFNTFNMGIGLVVVVDEDKANAAIEFIHELGEAPFLIGKCETGDKGVDIIW